MSEWISVKDKVPEPYKFYLVFVDSENADKPKTISIARRIANGWQPIGEGVLGLYEGFYGDVFYNFLPSDITHWMLIPSLPSVKNK